jgi:hypothetical protein
MLKRTTLSTLAFAALLMLAPCQAGAAPMISAGTPTTSVPTYLFDGSYLFGITVALGLDQFLLPVGITGAAGLQTWQFDVTFDNSVVQEVDPFDGTSGIYGAEFIPGDPDSLSYILGGFPFNALGRVDGVAGYYPNPPYLFDGVSGDGVLAYILFEYLPDQQNNDPGFGIENPTTTTTQPVPEPGTLALLGSGLALLLGAQRRARGRERHGV